MKLLQFIATDPNILQSCNPDPMTQPDFILQATGIPLLLPQWTSSPSVLQSQRLRILSQVAKPAPIAPPFHTRNIQILNSTSTSTSTSTYNPDNAFWLKLSRISIYMSWSWRKPSKPRTIYSAAMRYVNCLQLTARLKTSSPRVRNKWVVREIDVLQGWTNIS